MRKCFVVPKVFSTFAIGSGRNPDYNESIRYYFALSQYA